MDLDKKALDLIEKNASAAMIVLRPDGTPHATRIGVALVDGKVWSSGTQTRLRTKYLRRDPRSTLFVFDSEYHYLTLECEVTILDGPDASQLNLRYFQVLQPFVTPRPPEGRLSWFGQVLTPEEFLAKMVEEQRLIYQFEVKRTYGMY